MIQMTTSQLMLTIAIIALGTALTRFLPFWLLRPGRTVPAFFAYLGRVLPAAVIGMLVVYCLKDVTPLTGSRGLPELIAMLAVLCLYRLRLGTLACIAIGTILYMALVQVVFV